MSADTWIVAGTGLAGSIGSFILGYKLTNRNEKRREKEEIEKIHYLLNADYTLLNRLATQGVEYHKLMARQVMDVNQATNMIMSINTTRDVLPLLAMKGGIFTFWDPITLSGSLIKLDAKELRYITTTHRTITRIKNEQDENFRRFSSDLFNRLFLAEIPLNDRIRILQQQCQIYLPLVFQAYTIILQQIQTAHTHISWLDLQAEPIVESIPVPNTHSQNQPSLRADGVTVYPDGTEVDRHGTVIAGGTNIRYLS